MNYRIEALTNEKQLLEKGQEWIEFEKGINDISITYSYDYLRLFWQYFKDANTIKELGIKRQLLILFLYKQDQLIAIFPFCRITRKRKKIFRVHSIEFLGQQIFSNYSDIITHGITKDDYHIVQKWLFRHIKFHLINLSHIPNFTKNKLSVYNNNLHPFSHSSEVVISKNQTYNQYRNEVYSSNFKQNIRTLYNRINKAGIEINISYKIFEDIDIDDLQKLAEFKKESGKKNIYDYPPNKMFLTHIYKEFNATVCFIYFNKIKVAYLINLPHKEYNFWYDISFNREYKQFWVGTLLFDSNLEESFRKREFHVLLGWGIDFIKYRFCNKFLEISNYVSKGNILLSKFWYTQKKKNCEQLTKIFRDAIEKIHLDKIVVLL
jgi:hypothetical protein